MPTFSCHIDLSPCPCLIAGGTRGQSGFARISRFRWMAFFVALTLIAGLLRPVPVAGGAASVSSDVPTVSAGAGPVDRPAPPGARPDQAVPAEKVPPPVPEGVRSTSAPALLSEER
jgi:hypothetical protein